MLARESVDRSASGTTASVEVGKDQVVCVHCHQVKQPNQPCACPPPAAAPLTWERMTPRQRFMHRLGKVLAAVIAVGSGITTTAAFVALNIVSAGAPTIIGAAIIFFAGFVVNWYINANNVPPVLVESFGKGWPFSGLMEKAKGIPLATWKKGLMWFGIVLALAVGFTNAVLTSASTLSLVHTFGFLAAISSVLPPVAIFLAAVTFICLSATMLNSIRLLIKSDNARQEIKDFLRTLYSIDPEAPHNAGMSRGKILAVRGVTILFTLIIVPLAAFGLAMTMNAQAAGAKLSILKIIPNASVAAVELACKIIALGFAFLGRIPFTAKNVFKSLAKGFSYFNAEAQAAVAPSEIGERPQQASRGAVVWYYTKVAVLYSLALINAVGNGLISIVGGGGIPSGVGGSVVSAAAGASNIQIKYPSGKERSEPPPAPPLTLSPARRVVPHSHTQEPASSSEVPGRSPSSFSYRRNAVTLHSTMSSARGLVAMSTEVPREEMVGLSCSDSVRKSNLTPRSSRFRFPDPLVRPDLTMTDSALPPPIPVC